MHIVSPRQHDPQKVQKEKRCSQIWCNGKGFAGHLRRVGLGPDKKGPGPLICPLSAHWGLPQPGWSRASFVKRNRTPSLNSSLSQWALGAIFYFFFQPSHPRRFEQDGQGLRKVEPIRALLLRLGCLVQGLGHAKPVSSAFEIFSRLLQQPKSVQTQKKLILLNTLFHQRGVCMCFKRSLSLVLKCSCL